jgi:hypothetical protein
MEKLQTLSLNRIIRKLDKGEFMEVIRDMEDTMWE